MAFIFDGKPLADAAEDPASNGEEIEEEYAAEGGEDDYEFDFDEDDFEPEEVAEAGEGDDGAYSVEDEADSQGESAGEPLDGMENVPEPNAQMDAKFYADLEGFLNQPPPAIPGGGAGGKKKKKKRSGKAGAAKSSSGAKAARSVPSASKRASRSAGGRVAGQPAAPAAPGFDHDLLQQAMSYVESISANELMEMPVEAAAPARHPTKQRRGKTGKNTPRDLPAYPMDRQRANPNPLADQYFADMQQRSGG
eukprot:CAMPEP_0118850758 /NCGR_PEP_ID=MMETSP1163-20130328/469_1 /TAXON_ID=124430 /ORGANISM="Phaeomonas parva, Strain CCMP2877" /LENGTH=250 /DNA_ID=CAMNT_0006782991 /DNA_START=162 /DNA_END=910 /DNA_ORIENTATION=+